MYYHPELGPVPKVGLEVEVSSWQDRKSYLEVASELEEHGYMPVKQYSKQRHDYNCSCSVCRNIVTDSQYPVSWCMQYDASLPNTGAEFISSPFHVSPLFVEGALEAISIIGNDAKYPDSRTRNMRDTGGAEVGFHIHCYSPGPELKGMTAHELMQAIDTIYYYLPEMYMLANLNNSKRQRSLTYRLPSKFADADHHAALAPVTRKKPTRLEWRMFEMDYHDREYLEGSIVYVAALTQAVFRNDAWEVLESYGKLERWDDKNKTLPNILTQFSPARFEILTHLILTGTSVKEDPWAENAVMRLIERVPA